MDHLILDDNARILELQAVGRDITERKQAEAALRLSEERYALAVNAGKVGVWDWDIRTGAIYLDPSLKALLGYEDDEISNQLEAWVGYVHAEDRDRVMQVAHLSGRGLPKYEIEHRMVHKNGGIRWFLARGTVFRDADGQPYRMLGTDTDITERKQAEETLRRAEAKFRAVFEANFVPLCFWHEDGRILEANDAYLRLTGFTRAELRLVNPLGCTDGSGGTPSHSTRVGRTGRREGEQYAVSEAVSLAQWATYSGVARWRLAGGVYGSRRGIYHRFERAQAGRSGIAESPGRTGTRCAGDDHGGALSLPGS